MKTSRIIRLWAGVSASSTSGGVVGTRRISSLWSSSQSGGGGGGGMLDESTQELLGVDKQKRSRAIFLYDGG